MLNEADGGAAMCMGMVLGHTVGSGEGGNHGAPSSGSLFSVVRAATVGGTGSGRRMSFYPAASAATANNSFQRSGSSVTVASHGFVFGANSMGNSHHGVLTDSQNSMAAEDIVTMTANSNSGYFGESSGPAMKRQRSATSINYMVSSTTEDKTMRSISDAIGISGVSRSNSLRKT
jgi:hypothetical protein